MNSQPTIEQLALELSGRLVQNWPTNGQFIVSKLSVKYVILHKIDIANWYPSTYMATISIALTELVYQSSTGHIVDVGEFIFHQILRDVETHGINIPICFPRLITSFLLSHHSDLLTDDDVARPALVLFSLVTGPFQGAHVLDLPATFCPPHRSVGSSGAKLLVLDDGLHPSRDLVL